MVSKLEIINTIEYEKVYAVLFIGFSMSPFVPFVHVNLLGPISHPVIEERVGRIVLLYEEYQCSLSPNDKVRTTKEDDVSSPEYT